MALPHLLKYIYTYGNDDVIKRGKKIHALGQVELVDLNKLTNNIVFRVKDDTSGSYYKVYINKYKDPKQLSMTCNCTYALGTTCKHKIAALLQIQEMTDMGHLDNEKVKYDQKHTVIKMRVFDVRSIRNYCSPEVFNDAEKFLLKNKVKITFAEDETVKATIKINGAEYKVIIRKNEERNFDTSSNYIDENHPLCLAKVIVFLHLFKKFGTDYFDSIRNRDVEKNKLLALYGYSLNDDLTNKFEFTWKDGKPFLRVLDTSIKRVQNPIVQPIVTEKKASYAQVFDKHTDEVETITEKETDAGIYLLFDCNNKEFPYFNISIIEGVLDEDGEQFVDHISLLEINKYIDESLFNEDQNILIQNVRKIQPAEVNKYVNRNLPFGVDETMGKRVSEEVSQLYYEFLLPHLTKIVEDLPSAISAFVLPKGKKLKAENLQLVDVYDEPLQPQIFVNKNEIDYQIDYFVRLRGTAHGIEENECNSPVFYIYNHQLFLMRDIESITLAQKFLPDGKIMVSQDHWEQTLREFVLPLTKQYDVDFDNSLIQSVKNITPDIKLFLKEQDDHLLFNPIFSYKGFEIDASGKDVFIVPDGNKVLAVHRNKSVEEDFLKRLKNLHSNLVENPETGGLILKGTEILRDNWFFLFVDAMKEMQVPVFGFEALRNFRFNTSKPQTRIYISSNTDWFDAKVDIMFGEQKVGIAEIKKALANKQQYVELNDGTLGVLPEDWLKKYALLFRVGEGTNNKLKLSKYHKSVIDELYELKNEEELGFELEEKYANLQGFDSIKEIHPSEHLQPILRPYQTAGFRWLNYLRDVNWGGILADDMGLGKTVQTLSYIEHFKKENPSARITVVCPTTLIYNWENEIKKFTPDLTYHIHHGPARTKISDEILKYDIIITTYGTLRSDIKMFSNFIIDYLVLDESQAIKNPSSKVTKAANLLNAKHKLCLSGTPLQNNTFDIYAQMNFLNPGMLGSVEFFRQEFAIPIDKLGEADRKEHLRKILYPFILRRTKEQVAKDLPEKQEMILWCEMEDEQRKIYDAYRNEYRDRIMGTINDHGIGRSQFTILQGLMKLRQICDSPAILNEDEVFENHSIKIDELSREIKENMSNHKALIFSQFLGMLALIRKKLDELGIRYEYFDGSTSAPDREKAIQNFQNNDDVKVFLISLKAGGVGLNLTAADYVYIVDPWWNPAVEQQAIDRTHRIGQTKNIFAYRMICKDTIEDKILSLQEKKKALAKELISDETGFIKALTKEDVEYLFS
ncbi:MAG: helicase SNF2 [Chitinophagaceae bacterium]|nr:MAG: helicase SNF2 [Chitinophagaceae bacterium]